MFVIYSVIVFLVSGLFSSSALYGYTQNAKDKWGIDFCRQNRIEDTCVCLLLGFIPICGLCIAIFGTDFFKHGFKIPGTDPFKNKLMPPNAMQYAIDHANKKFEQIKILNAVQEAETHLDMLHRWELKKFDDALLAHKFELQKQLTAKEEYEYRYRGVGDAYWEEIEEKLYYPYVSLEQVNNLKARQKQ